MNVSPPRRAFRRMLGGGRASSVEPPARDGYPLARRVFAGLLGVPLTEPPQAKPAVRRAAWTTRPVTAIEARTRRIPAFRIRPSVPLALAVLGVLLAGTALLFPEIAHSHGHNLFVSGLVAMAALFVCALASVSSLATRRAAALPERPFGKILSPVSLILSVRSTGRELRLTPAQSLAKAIRDQLDNELEILKVKDSRPLPVDWKPISGKESNQAIAAANNRDIAAFYHNISPRRLVILGGPGSGKSVLAQRLARGILGMNPGNKSYLKPGDRGRPRLPEQIPVIFGLHAWEPGIELNKWLTRQLAKFRYSPLLTEDAAAELVNSGRILPILDGFDETPPWLHAEILGQLNQEEGPLILTSRLDEYRTSSSGQTGETKHHVVLENSTEIELLDLSPGDVADYLLDLPQEQDPSGEQAATARGARRSAWGPVVDEIRRKRPSRKAAILIEALGTPLMVALARDIYANEGDPKELLEKNFADAEEARKFLLENFVPTIYSGSTADRSRWTVQQKKRVDQAVRAFRYLAAQAKNRGNRTGKWIAWWEFGGTGLKSAVRRAVLSGLAAGLVMLVANGIATFLAIQGVGALGVTPAQGVVLVLGDSTAITLAFMVMHLLAAWHADAERHAKWVIQPSWVGLSIPRLHGNRTAGSWNLARQWNLGFAGGSAGGFVAMLGLILSSLLADTIGGAPSAASATIASSGWLATLLTGLSVILVLGVTAGSVAALQAPVEIESAGSPIELLAADRRLALGGGAVAGVLIGAMIGCLVGVEQGAFVGLGYAVVGCVVVWLGGAVSVTAWGQWTIWGRLLLPLKGELPWRTHAFLREAHRLGVLRQSGAYYQFHHTLLQELYEPVKEAAPVGIRMVD